MLREIARFELRYQMRTPAFALIAAVFFLLGFGAASSDIVQTGGVSGDIHRNAPFVILRFLQVMSLAGVLLTTALLAPSVARDAELDAESIFFATPLRKPAYLFGRFAGGFAAVVLVFFTSVVGMMLGSRMPWLDASELGPFQLAPYAQGFAVFALPNLFFSGAVLFTLASLTRSIRWTYVGVLGMLVAYSLGARMLRNLEDERLATLLDPFAFGAFFSTTKYWTVLDKNTRLLPLDPAILANRALVLFAGCALLALNLRLFRLRHGAPSAGLSRRAPREPEIPKASPIAAASRGAVAPPSASRLAWYAFFSQARLETKTLAGSAVFLVSLAFGVINVVLGAIAQLEVQGMTILPVTHVMVSTIQGAFSLTLLIVLAFASGDVVFRDRTYRMDGIIDSIAVPTWVLWSSKLVAVFFVLFFQLVLAVAATILLQLAKGYGHLELSVYAKGIFLYHGYTFALLALLGLFFHVITQNRYVGYLLVILFVMSQPALAALGFEHLLYQYASSPNAPYSDMNGFGPFAKAVAFFDIYWFFGAVLLSVLVHLFWQRGAEAPFRRRLAEARRRFRLAPRLVFAAATALFVATGGYIFYNTNVRNQYRTERTALDLRADYEKKYKSYESQLEPHIVAVSANVDIFPAERAATVRGKYVLVNGGASPVETLLVSKNALAETRSLVFSGSRVENEDGALGATLLRLTSPMAPGEKRELAFEIAVTNPGFRNNGENDRFVENGTFFDNFEYFPRLGYMNEGELQDPAERRKRGLSPVTRMPKLEDAAARAQNYVSTESDWIDFDTVVSTSPDQIALAPGYLQKEWSEGGRRYFHYKMDAPILGFFAYLSARYAVTKDVWNDVAIEIYHHPGHPYEVRRMVDAVKLSLDTFSTAFGPYQHRQVRILEFPRYKSFAQSFPNTIPFSEALGFIVKPPVGDEVDMTTFVTAHEVAHQWWAHQVIGARMQGSTMLSESLAQYSALVVMEKLVGREKLRRFLKHQLDDYLRGRGSELVEEQPLLRVEDQPYVHYNKGGMTFFALRDLLGAGVLDGALRLFVEKNKFKGPPYPTSQALVDEIVAVTPPDKRRAITDWIETITIYDGALTEATFKKRGDGKYEVTVRGKLDKKRADGHGNERDEAVDDWIDVGLFAGETTEEQPLGHLLVVEKKHVTGNVFEASFVVDEKPTKAWVDPYVLRVDRNLDNNDEEVVEVR